MSNEPTNTSNDVSRKEFKKEYISDEKIKEIIKVWAEGNWIYVAATDPEFSEKDIEQNDNESASSGERRRKSKRIKTTQSVMKNLIDLVNFPNVTIGAKEQTEKVKQVRKKMAERKNTTKQTKERTR